MSGLKILHIIAGLLAIAGGMALFAARALLLHRQQRGSAADDPIGLSSRDAGLDVS